MNSDDILKELGAINANLDDTIRYLDKTAEEAHRVSSIMRNTKGILDNLDQQFQEKTGLTSTDIVFLFIATALQIIRQYAFSNEKFRISSKKGDDLVVKSLSLAPPNWQEVLTQSVPYDAIQTGDHVDHTGLSGTTHRYNTLGHDAVFGWIFGTANIMTNSLTKRDFTTYQVNMNSHMIVRHYPGGVLGMLDKAVDYSRNDPKLLMAAVARQAIHLGSDYFTKQGLPIPGVAIMNEDLVKNMLTKWHIDLYSISRGAGLAAFINQLIFIIHGLFNNGTTEEERNLYEVRTRKILSYSNLIASSSNAVYVALTGDLAKLDFGGMLVTVARLIADTKFIRQIKQDFIFGKYDDLIKGNQDYLYIG